jgi:tetratricopeptide (TPR) repeat protein
LIERIVDLAENLTSIALIGVGGIGKTSIALTVLHHKRIKQRFGDNRWFTRCDQFTTSYPQFLSRLSKVIGAGIENPESLASLRPFLSSREILIVLDNAESILDPQGTDFQEIYAAVEELSQLDSIWLCITSRISTIPTDCETLDIPTLSIEAARDAFHRIHKNSERSGLIDNILEQLDFHPLSITLLATVAHHNKWGTARLAGEWEKRRTSVLQTVNNKSLAATIELSLASLMFQELGPDARGLLGVVAFFPQGVDENNIDWLFPTISNGANIIDKFCILSLTYRSNGFVMMLAPLRDYLSPKDPKSSLLLCMAKEHYFVRLSVNVDPKNPNFGETRWITSEDVNVEHLLDIFTTVDPNSDRVWVACANFTHHLLWHKKRLTILQPKIEGLPDDYNSKPRCLYGISRLFSSVGNQTECKRLLTHALKLMREQEDIPGVAQVLRNLSDANRQMGLHEEGKEQVEEALEIYERLDDTAEQADCLVGLAFFLRDGGQLDVAEETALRAINLLPEKGDEFRVCKSYRLLGLIYQSKGETDKAIHHYELALGIASTFDWNDFLFWVHYNLAGLFRNERRLDEAQAHVEHAKSHSADNTRFLSLAMEEQAWVWYKQHRLEEAKSEVLCAADLYEKAGATRDLEECRKLLRRIEKELNSPVASDCELL